MEHLDAARQAAAHLSLLGGTHAGFDIWRLVHDVYSRLPDSLLWQVEAPVPAITSCGTSQAGLTRSAVLS